MSTVASRQEGDLPGCVCASYPEIAGLDSRGWIDGWIDGWMPLLKHIFSSFNII